ncbi:hypothetical protein HIM_04934 [Hirsutella minnesotensis 3608]|uniref:DNA (cytosine-5-)-methyltransferase n=1 Tax=Hirsutella minnesotensis 3608 TaxID=1043627 RepID=A0A0F8A115_9HYPO|nr:hypothetical protein HIM_04934 [Hirsutella minnesotensis 3608]
MSPSYWSAESPASSPDPASIPELRRRASTCTLPDDEVVDLTSEEFLSEATIDLTNDDLTLTHGVLLLDGELPLENLRYRGEVFRPGDVIEVKGIKIGTYSVEFVEVKIAVQHRNGKPVLRGVPLLRAKALSGILPKKLNEVCMLLFVDQNTTVADRPTLIDVDVDSIVKKRLLIITNETWPTHCYSSLSRGSRDAAASERAKEREKRRAESHGFLVCRWKFTVHFVMQGRNMRVSEQSLQRLRAVDVSNSYYRTSEEALQNRWRGVCAKGGSWNGKQHVDLEMDAGTASEATVGRPRSSGQKYTVFDSFSGAGGVSRGAQSAGFKICYAVDKSEEVWRTYRFNFPDVTLYQTCVQGFIQQTAREHMRVDVLHLSPPCQFFSPAHTHDSVHDDTNISAFFSCHALIKKTRPRMVTLEQTFGIAHERHYHYLRTVIGDLASLDFSVRWKVVPLKTWGSAQDRKRLILIAAGPGYSLPPFPNATHSETSGSGLKSFTTIGQAVRSIPPGTQMHNVESARHFRPPKAAYSPNRLAGTMTTSGTELYHPSGRREFTLREYACLQGFPNRHRFFGSKTSIRRQIGNAFPPNTVELLYRHLQSWMLREDGLDTERPEHANAITLIDDIIDRGSIALLGQGSGEASRPPAREEAIEVDVEIEEVEMMELSISRRSEIIDLT